MASPTKNKLKNWQLQAGQLSECVQARKRTAADQDLDGMQVRLIGNVHKYAYWGAKNNGELNWDADEEVNPQVELEDEDENTRASHGCNISDMSHNSY
jgi:hypothetical protein